MAKRSGDPDFSKEVKKTRLEEDPVAPPLEPPLGDLPKKFAGSLRNAEFDSPSRDGITNISVRSILSALKMAKDGAEKVTSAAFAAMLVSTPRNVLRSNIASSLEKQKRAVLRQLDGIKMNHLNDVYTSASMAFEDLIEKIESRGHVVGDKIHNEGCRNLKEYLADAVAEAILVGGFEWEPPKWECKNRNGPERHDGASPKLDDMDTFNSMVAFARKVLYGTWDQGRPGCSCSCSKCMDNQGNPDNHECEYNNEDECWCGFTPDDHVPSDDDDYHDDDDNDNDPDEV